MIINKSLQCKGKYFVFFLTTVSRYYDRKTACDAMRYINGTRMDERVVRTDWDAGFKEGRQFGRGKSGGQVSCGRVLVGSGRGQVWCSGELWVGLSGVWAGSSLVLRCLVVSGRGQVHWSGELWVGLSGVWAGSNLGFS